MAGKRKKAQDAARPSPPPVSDHFRLVTVVVKALIACGIVVGVIAGVVWLGGTAGERVAGRDRYAVRVADIRCDPPPGRDRGTFLTEVRYLANLGETVQAVDPKLKDTLAAAFAKHPWVAEVTDVAVTPDAAVHVSLRFRVPVLAVTVIGEHDPRLVDDTAILLPQGAVVEGLPLLTPAVPPPVSPAGEPWPHPTVRRAAELADLHKPKRIEKTSTGWRMTKPDGRVLVVSW